MAKRIASACWITLMACFIAAGPVTAQEVNSALEAESADASLGDVSLHTALDPSARFRTTVFCTLFGPAEVQGYRVTCGGARFVDFTVSDGFIPGDHWSLKGKNWDSRPNTSVTTSPGGVIAFGQTARVYNYGGTPQNPGNMDTYIQCTYLHGVDVFPASSFVTISSGGACVVTPDALRSRIDRMP